MRHIAILAVLMSCASVSGQTLRELAQARGIHFGTSVIPNHLNESAYAESLAREFDQVEPENALKFGPIHPKSNSYDFGPADRIVEFAERHKMAVRGHTLVWHNQVPSWVKDGNFTPAERFAILEEHIRTVIGHYAGKVYAWDVVNEAFQTDGSLRKTIWSETPGYIEKAFEWAHAGDPKALLFYNDYSAEVENPKSDAIFKMAREFKARGVPLNGIGMQMHIGLKPGSLSSMEANMKRLTDLGLQVQITELDVKVPIDASGVAAPQDLEEQAKVYGEIVRLCVKNPSCTAIQTWGFTDRYSWIPGRNKGFGAALPLDQDYQAKPAYRSIADALRGAQ